MLPKSIIARSLYGLFSFLVFQAVVFAQDGPPPALVRTVDAELLNLAPITQVPGTVVSRNDARLSAEVEGRLLELADVGTVFAVGETIAVIEDTVLRLKTDESRAELNRAKASLSYLESEEKRLNKLAQSNLTSQTLLEQTRSQRDVARSNLTVAETRLAQANDQLDRSRIRAPFSGTVVERLARVGERLAVGSEVLRMVNPLRLEVVARAPLEYMDFVKPGDKLDIKTRSNRSETGSVRTVVAVGSENTHLYELRLDIPAKLFPVGQTLRVWIPTAAIREVLAVPRDALVLRSDGISVFLVDPEGTARKIAVETGIANGALIEVRGDLKAGDPVIIRGNERLQPGQSVRTNDG